MAFIAADQMRNYNICNIINLFVSRVLATGDSVSTVAASFRLGHSTVNKIVRTTVVAIYESLHREVLKDPSKHPEIWQKTADDFERYWNFPNCIGAIDGKHVMLQVNYNYNIHFLHGSRIPVCFEICMNLWLLYTCTSINGVLLDGL